MQQIAIEPVGPQPLQRAVACGDGAAPRRVTRQDLRDQKDIVAAPSRRLGHDEFGIAIHFGGIDMRHAEIDAPAQRRDRGGAIAAVDMPGALPDHGYLRAPRAEWMRLHDRFSGMPMSATSTVPVTDSVM